MRGHGLETRWAPEQLIVSQGYPNIEDLNVRLVTLHVLSEHFFPLTNVSYI
jgi:hypothetical protein